VHLFCSDPAPRSGLRGATSHADLVSLGSQMRPAVSTNDLSSAGGYGYSGPLSSRGARGARWSMYGADRPTPHGSVLFAVSKRKFPKVSVGARGRVDLVPRRKETRRRSCTAVSPAQAVLTWGRGCARTVRNGHSTSGWTDPFRPQWLHPAHHVALLHPVFTRVQALRIDQSVP
jgi:hypothetical protein